MTPSACCSCEGPRARSTAPWLELLLPAGAWWRWRMWIPTDRSRTRGPTPTAARAPARATVKDSMRRAPPQSARSWMRPELGWGIRTTAQGATVTPGPRPPARRMVTSSPPLGPRRRGATRTRSKTGVVGTARTTGTATLTRVIRTAMSRTGILTLTAQLPLRPPVLPPPPQHVVAAAGETPKVQRVPAPPRQLRHPRQRAAKRRPPARR
mmetsp:Transcript_2600/g.6101  ORF Transcript_2600/g.6101 Transcript_2600/m.6101 type:complete len:210 (+) Transcript_2600:214-843(+)